VAWPGRHSESSRGDGKSLSGNLSQWGDNDGMWGEGTPQLLGTSIKCLANYSRGNCLACVCIL